MKSIRNRLLIAIIAVLFGATIAKSQTAELLHLHPTCTDMNSAWAAAR